MESAINLADDDQCEALSTKKALVLDVPTIASRPEVRGWDETMVTAPVPINSQWKTQNQSKKSGAKAGLKRTSSGPLSDEPSRHRRQLIMPEVEEDNRVELLPLKDLRDKSTDQVPLMLMFGFLFHSFSQVSSLIAQRHNYN